MTRRINYFDTTEYKHLLNLGSQSKSILNKRNQVYHDVMRNYDNISRNIRSVGYFSTSSMDIQQPSMGVALREASIKAYLTSFAGYIASEYSMGQITELITYKDIIVKGSGDPALPFMGVQDPKDYAHRNKSIELMSGDDENTVANNEAIVPGSVKIYAKLGSSTHEIIDNRKGLLLAEAGVLEAGTVDYESGTIVIKFPADTVVDNDKLIINYDYDATVDDNTQRKKVKYKHFLLKAVPQKFEYEYDIIQAAIAGKSIGTSFITDLKQSVEDEHTMVLNDTLVKKIVDNYTYDTFTIDLSGFSLAAGNMKSLIRVFKKGLTTVDSKLKNRVWKLTKATALIVGSDVSDLFLQFDSTDGWIPNKTSYIDGFIGMYNDCVVLEHHSIPADEGYAIIKTKDGLIAPVGLGIFLPATDLPNVGNFLNTTEIAGGIYHVEGVESQAKELVQRFKVEFPSDWQTGA